VATRAGVEPAWNEKSVFAQINLYPTAPDNLQMLKVIDVGQMTKKLIAQSSNNDLLNPC